MLMGDLLVGLALVLAGVLAFGAQQYILRRNALREERRDRQGVYLISAYRAMYRLLARTRDEGDQRVLDRTALSRAERVDLELAIFDSRLFGDWEVVDAVRGFMERPDWDPSNVLNVLGKQIRRLYGLEHLRPTRRHPDREDLSDYLPNMFGLIGPDESQPDEGGTVA
jgi:hypothetical protein